MLNTLLRQIISDTSSSLSDYTISYITEIENRKDYYHPCYKIVLSLDNDFSCLIDGEDLTGLRALIINKNVTHTFTSEHANLLICLIKADSVYGHELYSLLFDDISCLDLANVFNYNQLRDVLPANYKELETSEINTYVEAFLNSIVCINYVNKDSEADKNIQRMIEFIDNNLLKSFEIDDLASFVNLSTDRAKHLFTQQMGFSMIHYLSWKRIKKGILLARSENISLAEACLKLGFNDQSHFNHTFKLILGVKPGEIMHNSQFLL